MSKWPSLAASMKAVAAEPDPAPVSTRRLLSPPVAPPAAAETPPGPPRRLISRPPEAATAVGPSAAPEQPWKPAYHSRKREGMKKATVTLSPEAHRQLKLLAVDHGGIEALLIEAINDLFSKHGKEPIA